MRKHSLTLLLSAFLVPAFAGVSFAQTAAEVVEKHLTALGGRAALAKLTSRRSTGTIVVGTPVGDLTGPVEMYFKAPNKARAVIRIDISAVGGAGEMVMEQVFDGQAAWILNSMQGDTPVTGKMLDNMKNNTFPTPLLAPPDAGAKLEVLPQAQVNGKNTIVLKATPKAGSAVTMYFDPDTFLLVRTVSIVDTPMTGEMEQTTDVSDYRAVDGLKVPFQIVNTNPQQTVTFKFTKMEHNVAIDDAMFVKK